MLSAASSRIVEEGSLMCVVFHPQVGCIRMDLGPGTLYYQEARSPYSLCWAYGLVRASSPISDSVGTYLFCRNACVNGPQACP